MSNNFDRERVKFYSDELKSEINLVTAFVFSGILAIIGFLLRPIEGLAEIPTYTISYAIIVLVVSYGIIEINKRKKRNMKKIHDLYSKIENGQKLELSDFKQA